MADTFTPNYNLTLPQIGGDSNTWGGLINNNFSTLDTTVKAVSTVANAALPAANFPVGLICLWSGAANAIPTGWALCNGGNGTPNLTNSFIVGAGNSYAVGAIGGYVTQALSVANMPSHNHAMNDPGHSHSVYDPGHTHYLNDPGHIHGPLGNGFVVQAGNGTNFSVNSGVAYQIVGSTAAATTGMWNSAAATGISLYASGTGVTTQYTGSGAAFDNRPPFYALCYIMYIG
jgi:hypothetical protein